ncbi:MAG: hypothetical protein J6S43_03530 [Lentisphaeria bacterium]|nr:hypothetical protein [Lentisphaeria bacterium]
MESEFDRKVALLMARDPRFAGEAYYFISEAVAFTVSKLKSRRHVSAVELLDGIRQFAVTKYGAVAAEVMKHWGMVKEDDAGEVVYLLIGAGLLRASESDSPDDFRTGKLLIPAAPVIRCVRRKSDKLPFID